MKVEVTRLPKTECYPCTKRVAQSAFGDLNLCWIGLGYPSKHFEFDSRCKYRPRITGVIVAEATYSPQREGWFCAYVVRKEDYPMQAQDDFRMRALPQMREWLERQIRKPDTAVLGYEYLLVVWDGAAHNFYRLNLHI